MTVFKTLALAGVAWLTAGSTAFAEVQLIIRNGQVSLVAKDATVRQILTEWARVGQTKIVNVERIPGGPITLELQGAYLDTVHGRSERWSQWLEYAPAAKTTQA